MFSQTYSINANYFTNTRSHSRLNSMLTALLTYILTLRTTMHLLQHFQMSHHHSCLKWNHSKRWKCIILTTSALFEPKMLSLGWDFAIRCRSCWATHKSWTYFELKTSHAVRLITLLSLSWGTNWCQTSCCPFGTPTRDLTMRFSTKVDNIRGLEIHYVCFGNNKNKS